MVELVVQLGENEMSELILERLEGGLGGVLAAGGSASTGSE